MSTQSSSVKDFVSTLEKSLNSISLGKLQVGTTICDEGGLQISIKIRSSTVQELNFRQTFYDFSKNVPTTITMTLKCSFEPLPKPLECLYVVTTETTRNLINQICSCIDKDFDCDRLFYERDGSYDGSFVNFIPAKEYKGEKDFIVGTIGGEVKTEDYVTSLTIKLSDTELEHFNIQTFINDLVRFKEVV